jgi:hypothetical protein
MWGKLARPLGLLIMNRIREIKQRFARLAARIAAGTYVPRRSTTRRRLAEPKPRQPNPLPDDFAWLIKLVPETAAFGSQLQLLFADPEMAALMAAAPAAMRRPLRSLCRMLGVAPPPVLALPAKPRAPRKPPRAAPQAPPPRPQPPEWLRGLRRSLPQFARARTRPKPQRA